MDKAEIRFNINKSAMVYGLYLGLFLIFKFFAEVMSLSGSGYGLVYAFCILMLPFLVLYFAVLFGRKQPPGVLGYWHYFRFIFMIFFFASTILAVAQYVYFAFINPGFLQGQYETLLSNMDLLSETMPVFGQYKEMFGQMQAPTPAMMVYQTIWIYVLAGVLLGFPLAGIAKVALKNIKKPDQ